ncbi:MAG: hypothetical protein ACRDHZ_23260, partial [Ktedonobacteraceae bacterium]
RSQDHQFPPRWGRKQWPKHGQNFSNGIGKRHACPPAQDSALVSFYLPSRGFHAWFFSSTLYKVKLRGKIDESRQQAAVLELERDQRVQRSSQPRRIRSRPLQQANPLFLSKP